MAVSTQMGGSDQSANPEQLFAAGHAACFHSALQGVARARKILLEHTSVGSRVHLDRTDAGGVQLRVELEVAIPDLPRDHAQELVDTAHQVRPYSLAPRGNIDVQVRATDDWRLARAEGDGHEGTLTVARKNR